MQETTFDKATTDGSNPYLLALRGLLHDESLQAIETLVIAHDDPLLTGRLGKAVASPSAILPLAQSAWDFDDAQQAAAVAWAVDEAEVDTVILVGHSHGMSSVEAARQFFARTRRHRSALKQEKSDSLFYRVARAQDSLQRSKTQFVKHFERLHEISAVARQTLLGQLRVIGLFYLAEGGLFLAYEPEMQLFRPLLEAADGQRSTTGGERHMFPWSSTDTRGNQ